MSVAQPAEFEFSSEKVLVDLSYSDLVREISARFRVKPEEVTGMIDRIYVNPQNGAEMVAQTKKDLDKDLFKMGSFEDQESNGKFVFIQDVRGRQSVFTLTPYKGSVKGMDTLQPFNSLQIFEGKGVAKVEQTVVLPDKGTISRVHRIIDPLEAEQEGITTTDDRASAAPDSYRRISLIPQDRGMFSRLGEDAAEFVEEE